MNVLITGASGFIGKNLNCILQLEPEMQIFTHTKSDGDDVLLQRLESCDIIVHLAGVNRPSDVTEHDRVNHNLTKKIVDFLIAHNRVCDIIFTSSIQSSLDNPYGISKKAAEEELINYKALSGANVYIYRLPNVFGKWSKPNYNSVVATFCYNIARKLPIQIHDPTKQLELLYIDDLVLDILNTIKSRPQLDSAYCQTPKTAKINLAELAEIIYSFEQSRTNLFVPNTSLPIVKKLYSTYLSYLPTDSFKYQLNMRHDDRGSFTEFIKIAAYSQVSVNVSKPGVIKGNHWHKTKVEKFLVVRGEAEIVFKNYYDDETISYYVSDKKYEVVDIPPGYSHSIKNIGDEDLVTVIWANEVYSHEEPDTYRALINPKEA